MKIESIRLKNFKAFQEVEMRDIPKLCVLVGANGTGKSSFFSVFGFLKDAFSGNVNTALAKLGGARGFEEVRSRNASGPIELELKFRDAPKKPLIKSCSLKKTIPPNTKIRMMSAILQRLSRPNSFITG